MLSWLIKTYVNTCFRARIAHIITTRPDCTAIKHAASGPPRLLSGSPNPNMPSKYMWHFSLLFGRINITYAKPRRTIGSVVSCVLFCFVYIFFFFYRRPRSLGQFFYFSNPSSLSRWSRFICLFFLHISYVFFIGNIPFENIGIRSISWYYVVIILLMYTVGDSKPDGRRVACFSHDYLSYIDW